MTPLAASTVKRHHLEHHLLRYTIVSNSVPTIGRLSGGARRGVQRSLTSLMTELLPLCNQRSEIRNPTGLAKLKVTARLPKMDRHRRSRAAFLPA